MSQTGQLTFMDCKGAIVHSFIEIIIFYICFTRAVDR